MGRRIPFFIHPTLTFAAAVGCKLISKYYGWDLYRCGMGYTLAMLGLGLCVSLVASSIGLLMKACDSTIGNYIIQAVFLVPNGVAIYKVTVFWSSLLFIEKVMIPAARVLLSKILHDY